MASSFRVNNDVLVDDLRAQSLNATNITATETIGLGSVQTIDVDTVGSPMGAVTLGDPAGTPPSIDIDADITATGLDLTGTYNSDGTSAQSAVEFVIADSNIAATDMVAAVGTSSGRGISYYTTVSSGSVTLHVTFLAPENNTGVAYKINVIVLKRS